MGNTCKPMADSSQCMAKQIQYCKLKKKKKSNVFPSITLNTVNRICKQKIRVLYSINCI